MFLLETLHESTALNVDMRVTRPPPTTPEENLIHGALASWAKEFSKEYSPFVDLFFGLTHWRTTCQDCGTVSNRWESFNSLKGVVPRGGLGEPSSAEPPTLLQMIQGELQPEIVDGYQCDTCKDKRTQARRVATLWRLPQTLCTVLKRFTPDGRKIHTRMAPLPGGSAPVLDFAPLFSAESPERKGITTYELRAIVDHHGVANGGHYTAQCRHLTKDIWYLYDDEGLQEMPNGPIYGESTYILFWERTAAPAMAREA
jgi:ubiquitin carboxyl-terminal hydrolase 2/21